MREEGILVHVQQQRRKEEAKGAVEAGGSKKREHWSTSTREGPCSSFLSYATHNACDAPNKKERTKAYRWCYWRSSSVAIPHCFCCCNSDANVSNSISCLPPIWNQKATTRWEKGTLSY